MPINKWMLNDQNDPTDNTATPQGVQTGSQGEQTNNPFIQSPQMPIVDDLRENVKNQIRQLTQSDEQLLRVMPLIVDQLFEQYQSLQKRLNSFGDVNQQIRELMDLAIQRGKEIMPQPPEPPSFTKNEAIAMFLTSLINWRAAGIASQQLLEEKKKDYENRFEKYKVMSQLALDEYNKTMTRISALSQQMAQFELTAAQRQHAVMQTLATLFPQLETIRFRKEREALNAMLQLYKTEYQYHFQQYLQKGIWDLKIEELKALRERTLANLSAVAINANNPGLFHMATLALQHINPLFDLPSVRQAGEEVYQYLQQQAELQTQQRVLNNLLRDAQIRQTIAQARQAEINANLLEEFGRTIEALKIEEAKAKIALTHAQRQFLQTKGKDLMERAKKGELTVRDLATIMELGLLGMVVSENQQLISDPTQRNRLRDLSLRLYFGGQNVLGQFLPQFNTQSPQLPQNQPQGRSQSNPLFDTGRYTFELMDPFGVGN